MTDDRLLWLPLERAALCIACDVIFTLASKVCPACGSEVIMPMEKIAHGAVKA